MTISSLESETRYLINPSSVDFYPIQGSIEDHSSNLPLVVSKCRKIVDNLRYMIGMEAMYAAQAVDLREGGYVRLGKATQKLYDAVREAVPALHDNRDIYGDILKMYELISSEKPADIADSAL